MSGKTAFVESEAACEHPAAFRRVLYRRGPMPGRLFVPLVTAFLCTDCGYVVQAGIHSKTHNLRSASSSQKPDRATTTKEAA